MNTRTTYTWTLRTRRPDPPHTELAPGTPYTITTHDGGPYLRRKNAEHYGNKARSELEAMGHTVSPVEIREHRDTPATQRTIEEEFPAKDYHAPAFIMSIFRDAEGTDCTAGGESSHHVRALVVCDGELFPEPGPFKRGDAERLKLPVFIVGKAGGRHHLRPESAGRQWVMFGGNFAYSCDSRTPGHPVHIHDRIERS